jgi:4-carboxymuconolactone decarboxylase/3-oxoadipate enol-lactonase/4-carboxymuconolactone decarboxylase
MHARAALTEGGFSTDEVKEIVLQQAIYCGIPAAHRAFDALREVVDALA